MPYQFATEDQDYSDYAGGRVLYSLPGLPAFPVRLASEIFLRARVALGAAPGERLTLYDPTCGGATHLAALGFLHGNDISAIHASDVDPRALALAHRNLGLLSPAGLQRREEEIRELMEQFGKDSHAEALRSISALRERSQNQPPIRTRIFQANAMDAQALQKELNGETIHLVISDVPYGQLSAWQVPAGSEPAVHSPIWLMLDALRSVLVQNAVVAIAADKAQKVAHEGYRRIERFQVGKRRVWLLAPI